MLPIDYTHNIVYNIISSRGKEVVEMSKKKRRRRKPTARPERMKQLAADILAGTVSGLIVLAIQKLLNW
jgi:hypothetical protein